MKARKSVVILNENQLQKIIKESVKKALKESSVITRGTNTDTIIGRVPYDDNYVERFGPVGPSMSSKFENDTIEKYTTSLQKRIEFILKEYGLSCHIDAHQDNDVRYYEENDRELSTSKIIFNVVIFSNSNNCLIGEAIDMICKVFNKLSMINNFKIITTIDTSIGSKSMSILCLVKPDKNGREVVEKNPTFWDNQHTTKYHSFSKFKPDEDN